MKLLKENFHYLLFLSSVFFLGNPSKFPADDGFFYPQIAHNLVSHGFMGFNNLYLTNGFHPLWMVFCTLAEIINPFGKTFSLNLIWLFQVLLVFFGFRLLEKTIFNDGFGKMCALAFYCLMFFSLGTLYLTEAHLAFFTIALLICFLIKNFTNDFIFGIICSLVFLARLDHIFIIIPFGFYFWKQKSWNVLNLMKMITGFSILSVPYLVSNEYIFGNLVPISGKIKSSFPLIQDDIKIKVFQEVFIAGGFLYFIFLSFYRNTRFRTIKLLLLTGSLIQLLYNLFFQSEIGQWYFVSQLVFCGFFIHDMIGKLNLKILRNVYFSKIAAVFFVLFVCFVGFLKLTTSLSLQNNVFAVHSKFEKKADDSVIETIQQLNRIVQERSRIYVYDFPGKFAYYSEFNIIPADGLVANTDFFNELNSVRFKEFFKQKDIKFLLFPTSFKVHDRSQNFMGISVNDTKENNLFYIKNTLDKKVADSLEDQKDLVKLKSFDNPVKTWQPMYDSVTVYRLKE
ncbi:hypothetical protein MKJ01_05015 [Chryseobacterium sp. SSA4.19]|uniref:hypothetical protein n=1 Tax=Chryseobacterium sp. SSA4.19 TaxID=2919915 RepID=UPI001F4E9E44|nr:hypothetical protein [Chryseobacterium sp. SSA4.19]MCJ8153124.1 hypothetical protein [Chryseobacterium sp. SSA4.19]